MRGAPALLLSLIAAALLSACGRPPAVLAEESPAKPAAIHLAGEERGYLEPCGCTRPQLGGLARKGTALHGSPLLENGDLVDRGGRLSELKLETFVFALSELGCVALNVGEGDLTLGLDFLRSAASMATFPFLSANLRDETGGLVFPAHADFELAGRRHRVVGVLDPSLAPDHRVSPAAAAVAAALAETPEDLPVILLFHGGAEAAGRIADAFPRLSRVVYAHAGEPVIQSPRLLTPGDRSRWMIRLGEKPEVVELTESFGDHPRMVKVMMTYVRRLSGEDLLHRLNPRTPPEGGGYAGDAACTTCHGAAAEVHGRSVHTRAIEVLRKTGREVDPDCVVCHVIGYGEETGFLSVGETPDLARVGCESCHGPAVDHVANQEGPLPGNARKSCVRCHTADTDPHFDHEKKWAKIRHE